MDNIQGMQSGKMSPAHSRQIKERILGQSSKRSSVSKSRTPRCLYLKKDDGHTLTSIWEMDGVWLTELSMRNISEYPNVVVESTLSQILQAEVPQKYYLSPKACQGILRRAAARGKELPEMLKTALERQAQELKNRGFTKTAAVAIVSDRPFYEGRNNEGIYKFFREEYSVYGCIFKPTGVG